MPPFRTLHTLAICATEAATGRPMFFGAMMALYSSTGLMPAFHLLKLLKPRNAGRRAGLDRPALTGR
jgi:hypothetical protein